MATSMQSNFNFNLSNMRRLYPPPQMSTVSWENVGAWPEGNYVKTKQHLQNYMRRYGQPPRGSPVHNSPPAVPQTSDPSRYAQPPRGFPVHNFPPAVPQTSDPSRYARPPRGFPVHNFPPAVPQTSDPSRYARPPRGFPVHNFPPAAPQTYDSGYAQPPRGFPVPSFPPPIPQTSDTSVGILLHGPSGCGKTLMVKALANEFRVPFIYINCPELMDPYKCGVTEEAISLAFQEAKYSAPCILFLKKIDVLCRKNTSDAEDDGRNAERARLQKQLLWEMNSLRNMNNGVHLLATTDDQHIIEPIFLKKDQFHSLLVYLPHPIDRVDILCKITESGTNPAVASDVDFFTIGASHKLNRFTGADLHKLVQEAQNIAWTDASPSNPIITKAHFDLAISKIQESKRKQSRYGRCVGAT